LLLISDFYCLFGWATANCDKSSYKHLNCNYLARLFYGLIRLNTIGLSVAFLSIASMPIQQMMFGRVRLQIMHFKDISFNNCFC